MSYASKLHYPTHRCYRVNRLLKVMCCRCDTLMSGQSTPKICECGNISVNPLLDPTSYYYPIALSLEQALKIQNNWRS